MFCTKCGTELPDDSQFCRKCGQQLSSTATTLSGAAVAPAPLVEPKQRRSALPWILVGVLILLGIWGVVALVDKPGADKQRNNVQQRIVPIPVVTHRTVSVIAGSIVVQPSQYMYYRVEVPQSSSNVRLEGHFTATGGSGNDVEIVLLDEDGFVNWKNRHATPAYYNSRRVTQGTASVNLPNDAKTYYLVVSNIFSVVSNKAVSGDIKLHYDQSR